MEIIDMGNEANASHLADVFKIVLLNVVVILLVVAVVLIMGWLHGKRKQRGGLEDIDWDEEEERLLLLASAKKAQRKADANAQKPEPVDGGNPSGKATEGNKERAYTNDDLGDFKG